MNNRKTLLKRIVMSVFAVLVVLLAIVTYFASRMVYAMADRIWTTPLMRSQRIGGFLLALVVSSGVFLLLFGWLSWPIGVGYTLLTALGLTKKLHQGAW